MAIVNQKRVLNLIPKTSAPVTVHVSFGDHGSQVEFTLLQGDEVYTIPSGVTASVHGVRQDGVNFGPYSCSYSGSKVYFTMQTAITNKEGSAIAEVVLADRDGNMVGSANFAVMVEKATFPVGVTYDNDVSVYEAILNYVQSSSAEISTDITSLVATEASARDAADTALQTALGNEVNARTAGDSDLTSSIQELSTRIDLIETSPGSTTGDLELQDIHLGADGVTYNSAGTAVRTQFTDIKNSLKEENIIWNTLQPDLETGILLNGADKLNCYNGDVVIVEHGIRAYANNKNMQLYFGARLYSNGFWLSGIEAGQYYTLSGIAKCHLSGSGAVRFYIMVDNSESTDWNYPGGKNIGLEFSEAGEIESRFSVTFLAPQNKQKMKLMFDFTAAAESSVDTSADFIELRELMMTKGSITLQWKPNIHDITKGIKNYSDNNLYSVDGVEKLSGWVDLKYIRASNGVFEIGTPVASKLMQYLIVPCQENDRFLINVYGGNNGRGWGFSDENNNIIVVSDTSAVATNTLLIAPENSAYLILNNNLGYANDCYKLSRKGLFDDIEFVKNALGLEKYKLHVGKVSVVDDEYSYDTNKYGLYLPDTENITINEGDSIFLDNYDIDISSIAYYDNNKDYHSIKNTIVQKKKYTFTSSIQNVVIKIESNYVLFGKDVNLYILRKATYVDEYVPAYYFQNDYLDSRLVAARTKMNSNISGDTFIWITDSHYYTSSGSSQNGKNSMGLIKYLINKLNIGKVFFGGDVFNSANSRSKALGFFNTIRKELSPIWGYLYNIIGNHEYNNPGATVEQKVNETTLADIYSSFMKDKETQYGSLSPACDYWIDNPIQKIRYFCIGCNYGAQITEPTNNDPNLPDQIKWFCEQLLEVPDGYTVIILSHIGLTNESVITYQFTKITSVMDAANSNLIYTHNNINYDYRNKNFTIACAITGHVHNDLNSETVSGIPVISTTCDRGPSTTTSALFNAGRELGTISEQAFDIVTIDTSARKIYMTRIGGSLIGADYDEDTGKLYDTSVGKEVEYTSSEWVIASTYKDREFSY